MPSDPGMPDLRLASIIGPSFDRPWPSWWRGGVVVVIAYVINLLFSCKLNTQINEKRLIV
jgi:hypothetical protein